MPAPEVHTERAEDKGHAVAFRDLEERICNLYRWAELADRLVRECVCDQRSWRELELAALVVERLSVSASVFRDGYYRAWKDAPEDCS